MKNFVKLIVAALLVILVTGTAQAQVQNPANGHWYQAVAAPSGGITWAQAKAAAESMVHDGDPGHLVTITSAAEQTFVTSNFPIASSQNYWIGAFQPPGSPEPGGGFQWVTGEPWSYTAWNSGEPNNAGTNNLGDAVEFVSNGLWNDTNGSDALPGYVVEFEPAEAELLSFTINASNVPGGRPVIGKVILTSFAPAGGAVVTLSNTNSAATVPATVTVPAGARMVTFTIATTPVSTAQTGSITALYNAETDSAFLEVRPVRVKLVTLAPNAVIGGTATQGLIVLEAPALVDTFVTVTRTNAAVVKVPPRVKILAGQFYRTFKITTVQVGIAKTVAIRATANGLTVSTNLFVYPP
ncbi:MAG TPA: C-type lectin domain-containing protein [Abditibacteriaceae bacterium]|nr:C-type lectin domain-containing protein [Abditibacteriaceae bacterium]